MNDEQRRKYNESRNERRRERYKNDPEYRESEKVKNNARANKRYSSDPLFREKVKARQRDRRKNDPEFRAKDDARSVARKKAKYHTDPVYREKEKARTRLLAIEYNKTPEGKAARAWNCMKSRAGNRCGKQPSYVDVELRMTREEFLVWAIPEFEKKLAEDPNECWTIDRLEKHYELGKIEIVSKSENTRRKKGR